MQLDLPARWSLAIHGGAGLIRRHSLSPDREAECRRGLQAALDLGRDVLAAGGSALDAVEVTVRSLEECPVFNAGRGSVLDHDGAVSMDAAIACGRTRDAGALTGAKRAASAIGLARAVMEQTPHVFVADPDALAAALGLDQVDNQDLIVADRQTQWAEAVAADAFHLDHGSDSDDVYGTVGAVAKDTHGHIAAATSTGGMVNKRWGRVGDSPLIGAGTWAWDATCAISATGHGEPFIRLGVAGRISALMELAGLSLDAACHRVVHDELPAIHGTGGVIAVDGHGRLALPFNSGGMFRGWVTSDDRTGVAIW